MSTRQYIGARYTPKFSGTYDATQAYEALEVVDNGSGTTYIARKPVPPNIPLTNTEYWLVYGSSSGAILNLQERVGEIEEEIPVINSSILRMGGEISDNTSDISNLSTRVNTNAGNISSLNTRVTSLENNINAINKVIIIGDSYVVRNDQELGKRIAINLGISTNDYVISAAGSTGFAHANNGVRFVNLLENVSNAFTHSDVTHIIVVGGANDSLETDANIRSYISAFITYAGTEYPNAMVYVGFAGATSDVTSIREYGRACYAYHFAANSNLQRMVMISNLEYVLHNKSYLENDGVHPNLSATRILAACVAKYIKHLEVDVNYFGTYTLSGWTRPICEQITNETAHIWSNSPQLVTLSNATNFVQGTTIDIGNIPSGFITGSHYFDCGCPATIEVFVSGVSHKVQGMVIVEDGHLYVKNCSYDDVNNVSKVFVPQFNIAFPTVMC